MIARNTTQAAIEQAADAIGVRLYNFRPANKRGDAFLFVLRPILPTRRPAREYGRWFRKGMDGKRTVAAVCWHGHREFFRKLFELAPATRVQTRATRSDVPDKYYTAENFERVFTLTDRVIGANVGLYSDACFCGDTQHDRVVERLSQGTSRVADSIGVNNDWYARIRSTGGVACRSAGY